jgi:hypothetical protein
MPITLESRRAIQQANVTQANAAVAADPSSTLTAKPAKLDAMGGVAGSNAKVPAASVDPPFLPAGFDWQKTVSGLRSILGGQGMPEALLSGNKLQHIMTTDFDGTFGRSGTIPVYLRAKTDLRDARGNVVMKAGDYFKDDKGNDLMIHGTTGFDVGADLKMLQTKYPNLPWTDAASGQSNVSQDWSEWDSRAKATSEKLEPSMVRRARDAAKASEPSATFIITARTNAQVAGGMLENQAIQSINGGPKANKLGVICSGDANVQQQLGVDDPKLSDGQRKAIIQMALVMMAGSNIKSTSFTDDGPSNDAAAIGSVSAKFPTLDVKVFQAVHHIGVDQDSPQKSPVISSKPVLVAMSDGLGGMKDPRDGSAWTADKLAAFSASPLPQLPQLTPDQVADG